MNTEFWNERYRQTAYVYGESPNVFFAEELAKRAPGKLFLPAEGEGRNAVFAAREGWQVDAMDYAEAGRDKTHQLARQHGVTEDIHYTVFDINDLALQTDTYDAIGVSYMHLPPDLRDKVYVQLVKALKPGGVLIAEVFHPEQIGRESGGPPVPELMYTTEQFEALLPEFEFLLLEKATTKLHEGRYHEGEAIVMRAVALKP